MTGAPGARARKRSSEPPFPRTGHAVAVSPHLDDAVFSAGGTIAALTDAGWRVTVVTCFTASVADPTPFALSTQLDKGLGPDVDYMALRRAEDVAACAELSARPVHLPVPEAPHRGYTSAADLFAGVHDDDGVVPLLVELLAPVLRRADLVLAPQALGDHADHRVVAEAVARVVGADAPWWWRDAPYALRRPDARPWTVVPDAPERAVGIGAQLERKIAAARRYTTQLGFQFGGADGVGPALRELAGPACAEGFRAARCGGAAARAVALPP